MILIEYACRACGTLEETWARRPISSARACAACGGPARRRFGGSLLATSRPPSTRHSTRADAHHGHSHGIPGDCVLQPTAARMLEARVQGNHRAIEQETAYQEKAISKGELDPRRAPTVDYPGQSTTT